jgi:hypothetical protein
MQIFSFLIGNTIINISSNSEKQALQILILEQWELITKFQRIELLGETFDKDSKDFSVDLSDYKIHYFPSKN